MPEEYIMLKGAPEKFEVCPNCGADPFVSDWHFRGCIQRPKRDNFIFRLFGLENREYCAVICKACGEIVGYENPKEALLKKAIFNERV